MATINSVLNSFLFWAAWIIIPFIMEMVPAIGNIFILFRKHKRIKQKTKESEEQNLGFYPEITLMIPVRAHWKPASDRSMRAIIQMTASMSI